MYSVSIIIPLYNSEKFIAATIQSALDQTWPQVEVIVVDDGSKDNSYEIALGFEKYKNVSVYRQQNSGACAARNLGFAKSTGNYIQYLDADDLLAPDKIERQLTLLKNENERCLSSCMWGKFSGDPGAASFVVQDVWKDMEPADWLATAWLGGGMMQTACWLTPRTLIEEAGPWDEELLQNPNDDGEFFCRVLIKSSGIRYCEQAKVYYREHQGPRVSINKSYNAVNSMLKTFMSYEEQILKRSNAPIVRKAIALNYASFMYSYIDSYKELAKIAEERLSVYGLKGIDDMGGGYFNILYSLFGFKNALMLRGVIRKMIKRSRPV